MILLKILLLVTFSTLSLFGYDNCACNHEYHQFIQNEWDEEAIIRGTDFPEPLIISLGFNCTPAMNMEKNNLRTFAFPFDWMGCSLEGLCALFENDFKDFLNAAYLYKKNGSNIIINRKYNLGFWHDFPTHRINGQDEIIQNWVEAIPDIALKYERRIKRLYDALHSDRTIYLFRSACSHHWPLSSCLQTKDMVIKLRDILRSKFPKANFTLIVINEGPDTYYNTSWNIPGIKNFYMQNYDMPHEWTRIFRELNLIQ